MVAKAAARTVLVIIGMRNNACRDRVAQALAAVKGVKDVSVSLMRAKAAVTYDDACEPAGLVWAVVNAGYGAALDTPGGRE